MGYEIKIILNWLSNVRFFGCFELFIEKIKLVFDYDIWSSLLMKEKINRIKRSLKCYYVFCGNVNLVFDYLYEFYVIIYNFNKENWIFIIVIVVISIIYFIFELLELFFKKICLIR